MNNSEIVHAVRLGLSAAMALAALSAPAATLAQYCEALPALPHSGATTTAAAPGRLSRFAGRTAPQPGRDPLTPYLSFRAGLALTPNFGFAGGLDFTFPRLSLGPQWTTRVTADVQAPFNARSFLGAPDTRFGVTLDQVYRKLPANEGVYIGAGLGIFGGGSTAFGERFFAGYSFSSTLSAELGVALKGAETPLVSLQVRLSAL